MRIEFTFQVATFISPCRLRSCFNIFVSLISLGPQWGRSTSGFVAEAPYLAPAQAALGQRDAAIQSYNRAIAIGLHIGFEPLADYAKKQLAQL
ncbi:MAG: hypothetical protein KME20_19870 [Kaiparowitsia implicata GSE-PSE-MK54-09C]|nr:hypothetical protein [Kaiparowitsia implicata GSE-PSE-MK54-09C]